MRIGKEFTFDSAHFLPNYYGQCERMHGHTYRLQVLVEGQTGKNGLVIDFVVLKKIVKELVLDKLDHQLLNDFIPIPSCENIAQWIWQQLADLNALVQTQFKDPQLPGTLKKYFSAKGGSTSGGKDPSEKPLDSTDFPGQVTLAEIKLWETPTSFVEYCGN